METNTQNTPLTKKERRELGRQEKFEEQKKRKLKELYRRIALWSFAILVIGGGVFGMVKLASRSPQDGGPAVTSDAVSAEDWVKGNQDAQVVLIEYSDFQCPACAFYYPLLKNLTGEYGDQIAMVYRHFPLPNHQNAKPAAYAAEAAGRQGKFWEMHDMIFENQEEWQGKRSADEIFLTYAQALNLHEDQFKTDVASKEIKEKVATAYQNATGLGLNSTPTFFLNGAKISNPRNYDELKSVIAQAINGNP